MSLIPLPYRILGAVLIALALLATGYFKGRSDANANCQIKIQSMLDEAQKVKDAERSKADQASARVETANAEAKIIYRTITKEVDHVVEMPVYRNTCLDDPGLQLANAALAGAPASAGEPNPAMSKPDATQ